MVIEYDWIPLNDDELSLWNNKSTLKHNSNIVENTCFTISDTVKQIFEQRKFMKKTKKQPIKIIESMLNNLNTNWDLDNRRNKINTCMHLLFSQYSIQLLDYNSIVLHEPKDRKNIYYILKSYWVPDDIFDEVLTNFYDHIRKNQKESEK